MRTLIFDTLCAFLCLCMGRAKGKALLRKCGCTFFSLRELDVDRVTGLPNKRVFDDYLGHRYRTLPCGVSIDLWLIRVHMADFFRSTCSAERADALLAALAREFRHAFEGDADTFVAFFGHDQFAIFTVGKKAEHKRTEQVIHDILAGTITIEGLERSSWFAPRRGFCATLPPLLGILHAVDIAHANHWYALSAPKKRTEENFAALLLRSVLRPIYEAQTKASEAHHNNMTKPATA